MCVCVCVCVCVCACVCVSTLFPENSSFLFASTYCEWCEVIPTYLSLRPRKRFHQASADV